MTLNFKLSHLTLDQWQAFVESHPRRMPFHHRKWLELLMEQYDLPLKIPAVEQNGRIGAALPFLETRNLTGTRKWISLPFTDCVRPLALNDEAESILLEELKQSHNGRSIFVVVRTDRPMIGVRSVRRWVRHELDISPPYEALAKRFSKQLVRNLHRGQQRNLRFEVRTDQAAVHEFYALHLQTRRRLGIPVPSKRFFTQLHERLIATGLGFVGLVMKDANVVAAGVFLTLHQTIVYKYAASDSEAWLHRPNEFLVNQVIRLASEQGYRALDLGLSGQNQIGLRRFKDKWGAVECDVWEHYLLGNTIRAAGESRAFKVASAIIRHSPPVVCQAMGTMFYRYSQ